MERKQEVDLVMKEHEEVLQREQVQINPPSEEEQQPIATKPTEQPEPPTGEPIVIHKKAKSKSKSKRKKQVVVLQSDSSDSESDSGADETQPITIRLPSRRKKDRTMTQQMTHVAAPPTPPPPRESDQDIKMRLFKEHLFSPPPYF